jgi:hypothetical protein
MRCTATPNRMDGADLLALCSDNLVYECQRGPATAFEHMAESPWLAEHTESYIRHNLGIQLIRKPA